MLAVAAHVAAFAAVVLLVGYRSFFVQLSVEKSAWIAVTAAVLAAVTIMAPKPRRWISVPAVYFFVFTVFHLGLAPLLAFGWDVPEFSNPFGTQWIVRSAVAESLYVVAVSLLCFAIGARVGGAIAGPLRHKPVLGVDEARAEERCAAVAVGIAAVGVLGWFAFVAASGGTGLFFGSYVSYREVTASGPLPLIYLLITMGAALTAVNPSHHLTRPAVGLLAMFAIVAFPLGVRGAVLFPLVAGIAVVAKRRALGARPLRWLAICLLLFSVIAVGRSVRTSGIAELGNQAIDVNPLHGLAELGYSLRPVAETITWQATIDKPAQGRTYIRPFQRALARLVPSVEVPPSGNDMLIMNVLVERRVGPIGFSPVAEGFVNFGLLGAAGYLMLVGLVLGILDRQRPTTSNLVLLAVVLVPLLVQIRNSFVAVPFQLGVGVVVWAMITRGRRTRYHVANRSRQLRDRIR